MSDRDIDSTSENVLHDWRAEESPEAEPEDAVAKGLEGDEDDGTLAWGTASVSDPVEGAVSGVSVTELEASVEVEEEEAEAEVEAEQAEVEVEESAETGLAADVEAEVVEEAEEEAELGFEPGSAETDGAPIAIELSREHAAGDLHIPDGFAVLEGEREGGRRAVGVVVSRFNGGVTTRLLDRALEELAAAGVRQEAITIMVVPGAFELPLAATALAKTRRFACVVALGCIIRGDTPHFDYVASETASGLQLAALETGVPVSFGVLTLDRVEQAEPRIEKGAEAVRSALEMADLFAHLRAAAAR